MMDAMTWIRACVVALVALTIGSMAHTTAGGLLPGPAAWLTLFGALAVTSAAALTTPAGYPRLVALVGGGQAAVHLVLSLTAGHAGSTPAAAPRTAVEAGQARSGGVRDQLAVVPDSRSSAEPAGSSARSLIDHLVDHLVGADAWMLLTHLVASAAVAWWLWRGEQAAWALIAMLWGWVVPLWQHSGPLAESAGRLLWQLAGCAGCRRVHTGSISRRGPPPPWPLPS